VLTGRNILIVEDDPEVRSIIARLLEGEGTHFVEATGGAEAVAALRTKRFDLVLLDLKLPDDDGLDILRRLRQRSMVPVIVLTAQSDEVSQVLCLELGADDYIIKPFFNSVLLARMKNAMRRWEPTSGAENGNQTQWVNIAGWRLDGEQLDLISPAGDHVSLTGAEYRLLRTLLEHRDQVVSREELSVVVLGRKLEDSRSIDSLIARLRARFKAGGASTSIIRTVHGVGYGLFP
jgi:DNA-binding response OmpR family regulator